MGVKNLSVQIQNGLTLGPGYLPGLLIFEHSFGSNTQNMCECVCVFFFRL